jgi:hypothetical protein
VPPYLEREVSRLWWIPVGVLYVIALIVGLVSCCMPASYVQPAPMPMHYEPPSALSPIVPTCHLSGTVTVCASTPQAPGDVSPSWSSPDSP